MRASRSWTAARTGALTLSVGAILFLAGTAHAQNEPAPRARESFDPATGRNLLNYPPHRAADIEHMRLDIDIPDMDTPRLNVRQTITLAPIAGALETLPLNASLLKISSASSAGREVRFEVQAEQQRVTFRFTPPIEAGTSADLVVDFSVENPPEGLTWTTSSPAWPGRAPLVYSQGEAESNRYWFLSHDFPNERSTSEVSVTVPSGFVAVSNGHQVRKVIAGDRTRFDFVQDRPHVSYLITLVVGKFDVVDVGTSRLAMPVYVPPGKGELVKGTFGRTREMVALFERISGVPYPWAKYAQVLATNFSGGMENTSATTLYESTLLDADARKDSDQEDLISHELAHQWYGDLLTCRSWEHIWLNEGFASYFEHLWTEYKDRDTSDGPIWTARGDRDSYLAGIWNEFQSAMEKDRVDAPYQPAMVSKEYEHPDDVFSREANPYPKGASILHMLRARLGDRTFFTALQNYTRANADRAVETDQFRRAMEDTSGLSLQRFFDQWCLRPGAPRVDVSVTWESQSSSLVLGFEQKQLIDGDNPAFALEVPVWVRCAGDDTPRVAIAKFDTRQGELRMPLPGAPRIVCVDPELTTLGEFRVAQDAARWISQLREGPTIAAKLQAAAHLQRVTDGDPDAIVAALASVADSSSAHVRLRERCIETLGHLGGVSTSTDDHPEHPCSTGAFKALWTMARDNASSPTRVRTALIERLAQASSCTTDEGRQEVVRWLRERLTQDRSMGVRAQAVKAIARLAGKDALGDVRDALALDSHDDKVRKAALEALEVVDTPEALTLAMRYAGPGYAQSTRVQAAKSVAKLSGHNPDQAYELLSVLAESREPSTASAAVEALAGVDDPRVRPFLEERAQNARGRTQRHEAQQAIGKLVKAPS